jgi:hypothetical protein
MVDRTPVSIEQNIWSDAEQVDNDDLTVEQNYNNAVRADMIDNHVGSGILPEVLNQNILFDSLLVSGLLDATVIHSQSQPSDTNFGNQLEIELTNSLAAGKRTVKVAIIGLDFNGNLQYDTFIFKINEKQYTKKHYVNIQVILFNDFIGPTDQSFNLGGRVVIREANPFTVSRDAIMVAQDVEPNLFFRDFFVTGEATLTALLTSALPLFNIDDLNINTGFKTNQILAKNDVTTQIGEKFLATTNNIEKITLLLSVQNTDPGLATDLNWHGDLIVSIYPLQSVVDCPTNIVPNLAIDFPPTNIPLAQISVNISSLQSQGILLDGNPQPIDFVFSNTPVANGAIISGNYYAVTVKRSGSADKCDILIACGSNHINNSWVTVFTGTAWVDITEDNLWFKIYTDAIKVSDGQAYETGHGIAIPKTNIDPTTNIVNDYFLDKISFLGGEQLTTVLSSTIFQSGTIEDLRTGEPLFSRQKFVPSIQLLNSIDLSNLEKASNPLIIGLVEDKNIKIFDSASATISANLHSWMFVGNTIIVKIIDDITDGYRYDPNVNALVSNLLNGNLINAQIIPDATKSSIFYRIASAQLCTMIYGDVDGNGVVDDNDLALLNTFIGANLNVSPILNSQITTDGYHTTVINGYNTLTKLFINDFNLTFQIVDPTTNNVIASGSDGIIVVNPNDGSLASFESASVNFGLISNITNLSLVIFGSSNPPNNGSFSILSVDVISNHILDIRKLFYSPNTIKQMLRADIDGDFLITTNDGYLLQNYINKVPPFPPNTLPSSKIGTQFNIIQITVDPFLYNDVANTLPDRTDDFPSNVSNRSSSLHTIQDIFINDGYMQSHDFLHSPIPFNIVKQFSWENYLIAVSGDARFVPTIFPTQNGLTINQCLLDGITCVRYSDPPIFDPGRIDVFVPNNLILGNGGELIRPDNTFYKVDLEMNTITVEIPNTVLGTEQVINVFDYFVVDYNGLGITRLGYPALRFADCSTVQSNAILNNQVRFAVAVQSFSPNINGISVDGYTGPIVDGRIGVYIDHSTGLLRLDFSNLYQDPVLLTLNTKIQITVYLKKAGFNNTPLFVDSSQMANLLTLITN